MKRLTVALFTYGVVAVIVTTALRYYQYHTSPWRRVPSSAWEQLAAQMRAGRRVGALDAVKALADLDAWLSDGDG